MTSPRRQSPIERFLGAPAAVPGPFAVLGLEPQDCTDDFIIAALERQLQRIDMHPEGDTPEADEVRLALHAAAAQLLDTAVRQQLIFRWRDGAPAAPLSASAGTAADRAGLEHDAILIMAQYGGWNQESLRRLALLASARGLPSNAVTDILRQLSKRGPAASSSATAAHAPTRTPHPAAPLTPAPLPAAPPRPEPTQAQRTAPAHSDDEPTSRNREMIIIAAGLAVAAIALITLLGIVILVTSKQIAPQQTATAPPPTTAPSTPTPAPVPPSNTQPPVASPSTPPTATATAPAPAATAQQFADVHEAIRALRAAAEDARTQPDAAAVVFTDAVAWLGGWWCRLEVGQLRAANDAAVEFVYAVSKWPDAAAGAIDTLAAGAAPLAPDAAGIAGSDVWPAAWSAGMLVRLTRERDLPADIAVRIDRALLKTLGADRPRYDASFNAGAAAALARMPLRLIAGAPDTPGRPGPASRPDASNPDAAEPALRRWSEAITATLDDPLAQERLLADGLEAIMVSAAEPDSNRRVFEAIAFLATEIRWRRAGPARARLVDWFRDPRISSGDLNVLTNAMATSSAAEGVGPTMVLPWSAVQHEREKLRSDYASAWGIAEGAAQDSAAQAWFDAASQAIERTSGTSSPMSEIAQAAELALLNQAARHLWRGEGAQAETVTERSIRAAERAQTTLGDPDRSASILRPSNAADGQWALAFLSVGQNRQLRLERLAELEQSGALGGPADAETLVEAACFASPADIRAAAQRVAIRFGREPLVVNAMLELLPKAPKVESISTMIEIIGGHKLPRPSDPNWMLLARRALVERLAEVLAGGIQGYGAFDRIALLLRGAYGVAAPTESPDAASPPDAAAELADLWRTWRAEAETFTPNPHAPAPLEKIVSRRAGRAALAQGPVQTWAAEQAALAELLAYIVSGESPSRAPRIAEIMTELAAARRDAKHIFEQIRLTERAMLRLWLLRFGKDPSWSGN